MREKDNVGNRLKELKEKIETGNDSETELMEMLNKRKMRKKPPIEEMKTEGVPLKKQHQMMKFSRRIQTIAETLKKVGGSGARSGLKSVKGGEKT